jgi:hypothetical protein
MADPIPPPSDSELLEGVNAAIGATLRTGKSVTFNGRTYTANELPDLWDLRTALEQRVENGAGGASRTRVAAYCKGV